MALLWDIINMIVRIGALRYNNFFAIVSYIENMSLNLFISRKETKCFFKMRKYSANLLKFK